VLTHDTAQNPYVVDTGKDVKKVSVFDELELAPSAHFAANVSIGAGTDDMNLSVGNKMKVGPGASFTMNIKTGLVAID
jgi:hypothetical protein